MKTKEDELVEFELNNLKMCESDVAISKRIKEIYHAGIGQGWKESGQCPQCFKELKEDIRCCEECEDGGIKLK
ncbi:MAG: hypothetical protein ACTSQ4_02310 [Candidatus Heimdallarchaeaceae archaeon]